MQIHKHSKTTLLSQGTENKSIPQILQIRHNIANSGSDLTRILPLKG